MPFAGFAEAARRIFIGLFFLAGLPAWSQAVAQNSEAQGWYSKGLEALAERRYADARVALLQAVNLDPSFAGAWLDLAIATHAAGDAVQAEEFLNILEARFTLPGPIASGVADLRRRIQEQNTRQAAQAAALSWVWRSVAQGGAGYDTNANAGLSLTDLTLTLPGGGVLLPVNPALRPRADAYATGSLSTEGFTPFGHGRLEAAFSGKSRNNAHEKDFDTFEGQAGVGYASNQPAFGGRWAQLLPGPWRVGLNTQHLRLGGNTLLNSISLNTMHAWTQLPCSPQVALEVDSRSFPVAPNLDSRLYWLSGGISCPSPWPRWGGKLNATLRLGNEIARHDYISVLGRPGDNTRHLEATVSHQWSWAGPNGTHRLEAQAQLAMAHDTEGYSPLLADNARRRLNRTSLGLAYSLPLATGGQEGWLAILALQAFRQRSNLEVFRVKGQVAQVTVQKSW